MPVPEKCKSQFELLVNECFSDGFWKSFVKFIYWWSRKKDVFSAYHFHRIFVGLAVISFSI